MKKSGGGIEIGKGAEPKIFHFNSTDSDYVFDVYITLDCYMI